MLKHKFSMRNNAECLEIKGVPMFKCACGKKFQTKGIAFNHCKKFNRVK